jgi:hypothetical protein
MNKLYLGVFAAALAIPTLAAAQAPTKAADAVAGITLIPRSALFGNPEKAQARVSPDGKYISFIAPRDGVLNVWLAERASWTRPTHHQRSEARHPPALLDLRQPPRPLSAGHGRRRKLAPLPSTWSTGRRRI